MERQPEAVFEFGRNWSRFLRVIDEERIREAEQSLQGMLGVADLKGARLLDIGCGSGLFSLAARRLGARVRSFDADAESVVCALELRRRFRPGDSDWVVERGSVLDSDYIASLGQYEIVYSWGVLHHTGDLWHALDNAASLVQPGGRFFVSIYNDQGARSRLWSHIKRTFNALPRPLRTPYAVTVMLPREALKLAVSLVRMRPGDYVRSWTEYHRNRGMSRRHDLTTGSADTPSKWRGRSRCSSSIRHGASPCSG